MPVEIKRCKLKNPGAKPVPSVFDGIWNGVEWRLQRLYTKTGHGASRIWKGIEWRLRRRAWQVYTQSVYRLAFLYRPSLRRTVFVGITGSAGKSSTKDLVASILESHFPRGQKGLGTMNSPEYVARLVLRTRASDAYCVTEIALQNDDAGIDLPIALFRSTV